MKRRRKDSLCSGSSYPSTGRPSGSSLSLPHPHSSSPSSSSVRCSSHPRVATLVVRIKSCSVVSLVIPACRLSSWCSLHPRSRCLTPWTLSEHWHCVDSYGGRRIKKDLKYPCPSRSWWIVEAVVWSALAMSFVGFQLGSQSLCLRAML